MTLLTCTPATLQGEGQQDPQGHLDLGGGEHLTRRERRMQRHNRQLQHPPRGCRTAAPGRPVTVCHESPERRGVTSMSRLTWRGERSGGTSLAQINGATSVGSVEERSLSMAGLRGAWLTACSTLIPP